MKIAERKQTDREAVFEAALHSFTNGDSISPGAIQDKSGVNKARYYRLFEGGDDMIQELGVWIIEDALRSVTDAQGAVKGPSLRRWFKERPGAARALCAAIGGGLSMLRIEVETGTKDGLLFAIEAATRAVK